MLVQQHSEELARSLRYPVSDSTSISAEIANSANRAGKFLGFNVSGDPIAAAGSVDTLSVSGFMATVLDDATAAAALTTLGFSAFIQTLIDDADAAAARTTLALGDAATGTIGTDVLAPAGDGSALTGITHLFGTVAAKTSNYTVVAGDDRKLITADFSGGAFTLTLPSAPSTGMTVALFRTDQTIGTLGTIAGNGKNINGSSSLYLISQYDYVVLAYDGTEWFAVIDNRRFESSEQTITAAGTLTIAHSLGAKPTRVNTVLVCKTNEDGYIAGDEVTCDWFAQETSNTYGLSCVVDATNLNLRFGSNAAIFSNVNKTTGGTALITPANWKLVIRARS